MLGLKDMVMVSSEYEARFWFKDGNNHRVGGPAIEFRNGEKYWYIEGLLHRLDGPACELDNGVRFWFIENKEYSESEFLKITKKKS